MGVLGALAGKATGVLSTNQAIGLGAGGLVGMALAPPSIPKPPPPPSAPQFLKPPGPLIGMGEGSLGGTFGGNNRAPQIAGGKKTLLGA